MATSDHSKADHCRQARILAVDDDADILDTYRAILESDGLTFTSAETLDEGLKLAATRPFDVCLLDRNIGHDLGTEAVPGLLDRAPGLRIIMATATRDTDAAMEALGLGIHDYLVKPFSPEQLRIAVARQIEARQLSTRVQVLEQQNADSRRLGDLDSESPTMREAIAVARRVAGTGANVLILGESGTGKNVMARAIHGWSQRPEGNFVTVNCPSLNADLLENELFGHRKGAFSGAVDSTDGRVAQADGGSLFMDEIGEFPLSLQPKLLRFIQDKEYERVGDPISRQADVRLIAATNRDLKRMSEAGEFRQDLYYRLDVVSLVLPALRDRREDIVPLARSFLQRFAADYGCPARELSPGVERALLDYRWPGNVRELQNVIERAVILCPDQRLGSEHVRLDVGSSPDAIDGVARSIAAVGGDVSLEELERAHIEAVLGASDTLDAAAKTLGIDASTLYRKRKSYGLS
ncbi:MAG: sigma-54 dependent transcriptional regulator [Lysobacteraceae bacterium]